MNGGIIVYCKKCGAENVSGKFCRFCGAELEAEQPLEVKPQESAPKENIPQDTPAYEAPKPVPEAYEAPKQQAPAPVSPQFVPPAYPPQYVQPQQQQYAAPQQNAPQFGQPGYTRQPQYNAQPQYNQPQQYAAPQYNQQFNQQPQYNQMRPQYNQPQQPYGAPYGYGAAMPKKKSKAPVIIAVIAVLALLGVGAFFLIRMLSSGGLGNLGGGSGGGSSVKIMKDAEPDVYYQSIEKSNVAMMTAFTSNTGVWTGRGGADASIEITLTDEGRNLLSDSAGGMDLDWLKSLSLDIGSGKDGTKTYEAGTLNLNNTKIISFDLLLDSSNKEMLVHLPDFSSKYAYMDSNDSVESLVGASGIDMDSLSKVINHYGEIVIGKLNKVEKTSETVYVGGYSTEYDALTVNIDGETKAAIASAISDEARVDRDLENLIRTAAESADEDPDTAYADFLNELDKAKEPGGESGNDFVGTLTVYVDKDGEEWGRRYVPADGSEKTTYYLVAWNGNDFACEGDLGSTSFTGSGTRSGNKLSGSLTLRSGDSLVAQVDVENFDKKAAKDGKIYGTFTVTPEKDYLDDNGMSPVLAGFRFRTEISSETGKLDATVSVMNESQTVATIKVSSRSNNGARVPNVSESDKVDTDTWLESMDTEAAQDKLFDSLKRAGVPAEYLGDDDYGYDDDYDYDDDDDWGW